MFLRPGDLRGLQEERLRSHLKSEAVKPPRGDAVLAGPERRRVRWIARLLRPAA